VEHCRAWAWTLACVIAFGALALAGSHATAAGAAPPLWETDGEVSAIVEREGTVYVGGLFSYVGPHTGSGVALSSDVGAVDPAFP
jgi:hypothetical protein